MITRNFVIRNQLGLHARAAAKLVKLASRYVCDIRLARAGFSQAIDGKSILGILMLAAAQGTELVFTFSGADEEEAASAVGHLILRSFDEK